MRKTIIDLLNADNVYRTRHFIVTQRITLQTNAKENNVIISYDKYYKRTLRRDIAYNITFRCKENLEGKRLPSTLYLRTYIK